MKRWIWVSMKHATFALAIEDGIVTDAAPIARWAIGLDERKVARYFRSKDATFRELGCEDSSDLRI